MEKMMNMMVSQCKNQDKLFFETGVEEEVLNHSIETNKMKEDPEFKKVLDESMQKAMAKA